MKRILCLLLSIILVYPTSITIFAMESEEYIVVPVEYSDNIGHIEQLEIMTKDENVYVNAKDLSNRLGYQFLENGDCVSIYNKDNGNLPFGVTQFFCNSTKVKQMLFTKMVDTYEAPFSSIKNDKGYWIPLEYSLLLLNSGILLLDNSILIDIPHKDIIDYYYDIMKNANIYNFDWNKDFGYTNTDLGIIGSNSHIANIFNGILNFDGDSWAAIFQAYIAMDSSAYDKKYGENIALFLCSESDEELKSSIEKIKLYQDIFSEDGQLGKILTTYSDNLDLEVGALYKNCEKILEDIKTNNSSVVTYNKAYQALEEAFDKQTWFSNTGGNIIKGQKGISAVTSYLDIGLKVAEVVGYGNEFANQDEFSLSALTKYLDTSTNFAGLSKAMSSSMKDYTNTLSGSMVEYSAVRWFNENIDKWIVDSLPLEEILGSQANFALFAWNIASNVVPFISNALESADKFELALYSLVFQSDAFLNYQNLRNSTFDNINTLSPEKLYNLSQYCYIYLKSCYITRNAALGSLIGKSDSIKEQIQPLIDYQNSINSDISKKMVAIKEADKTNECNVYGFLPDDNVRYLKEYDNSGLITWIKNLNLPSLTPDEAISLWTEFLISENYSDYTKDWDKTSLEYVIADLNADTIPELLIQSSSDRPFFNTWVFTLKNKDIFFVNEMYGYGSFRYSPSNNMIIGTPEWKPFSGTGYSPFYRLEGTQLEYMFGIVQDEGKSYYSDSNGRKEISDDERFAYYSNAVNFEWCQVQSLLPVFSVAESNYEMGDMSYSGTYSGSKNTSGEIAIYSAPSDPKIIGNATFVIKDITYFGKIMKIEKNNYQVLISEDSIMTFKTNMDNNQTSISLYLDNEFVDILYLTERYIP